MVSLRICHGASKSCIHTSLYCKISKNNVNILTESIRLRPSAWKKLYFCTNPFKIQLAFRLRLRLQAEFCYQTTAYQQHIWPPGPYVRSIRKRQPSSRRHSVISLKHSATCRKFGFITSRHSSIHSEMNLGSMSYLTLLCFAIRRASPMLTIAAVEQLYHGSS